MTLYRLESSIRLDAPREAVFDFFADAANLERITPPWLSFQVDAPRPIEMREGTTIDYRLRIRGVPVAWRSRIALWKPPEVFVDVQERGPYRLWNHVHWFQADGDSTVCRDAVTYAVPGGDLVHRLLVRRDVESIFRFRHRALAERFGAEGEPDVAVARAGEGRGPA